jgi:Zn ribbon nucleic-acid-binding protein
MQHSLERKDSAGLSGTVVRCPFCVLGDEFRPMVSNAEGEFTCEKCGHIERPADKKYSCRCYRCRDLSRLKVDSGKLVNRPTTSSLKSYTP